MQNDNLMIIHLISKIAALNFLALLKRYKLTDEKNTKKRNQGSVLFEMVLKVVCIKNVPIKMGADLLLNVAFPHPV